MTPTATVCRMSRTAKRPRGAYSVKASTHIGLEGTSFTMAESPDFTHLGVSSRAFPERRSIFGRIGLGISADVSSLDLLDGDVLHVEADIVAGQGLGQAFVVHLHGLYLSSDTGGGEGHHHTGLQDTGLHTAHGYCSNTANLVDVLQGQTEGLVAGPFWWQDRIEGVEEGLS